MPLLVAAVSITHRPIILAFDNHKPVLEVFGEGQTDTDERGAISARNWCLSKDGTIAKVAECRETGDA